MTTAQDLVPYVGGYVRIKPHDGHIHWGRGRLRRIDGEYAIVLPFNHEHDERLPISDLKPWKVGNKDMVTMLNQGLITDGWVVVDINNYKVFVSPQAGFKPELNRAKVYDSQTGSNRAIGYLRKFRKDDIGTLRGMTINEAKKFWDAKYHPETSKDQREFVQSGMGDKAFQEAKLSTQLPGQGFVPTRTPPELQAQPIDVASMIKLSPALLDKLMAAVKGVSEAKGMLDMANKDMVVKSEVLQSVLNEVNAELNKAED